MKIPLWIKWIFFSIIIFTSFVLPLALLEPSLANYGNIALDWAGSNKLFISFIVIFALAADVILPIPTILIANAIDGSFETFFWCYCIANWIYVLCLFAYVRSYIKKKIL